MESIAEIRHRIQSINQTRQITKAMHMISSAKIRRGLKQYHDNDTYTQRVHDAVRDVLAHANEMEDQHPFLEGSDAERIAMLVVAGDKGLAGGFNHNVIRLAKRHMEPFQKISLYTIGHVAADYFERHRSEIAKEGLDLHVYPHIAQDPRLYHARAIATELTGRYRAGEVGRVWVAYTQMINPVYQIARVRQLLPLRLDDSEDGGPRPMRDLIFQPSSRALLDTLVPQIVIGEVFSALIQSYTSEHAARVRAMESATRNADEYLEKLRLHMNRARQAVITQEIAEIIGGVNALEAEEDDAEWS